MPTITSKSNCEHTKSCNISIRQQSMQYSTSEEYYTKSKSSVACFHYVPFTEKKEDFKLNFYLTINMLQNCMFSIL